MSSSLPSLLLLTGCTSLLPLLDVLPSAFTDAWRYPCKQPSACLAAISTLADTYQHASCLQPSPTLTSAKPRSEPGAAQPA